MKGKERKRQRIEEEIPQKEMYILNKKGSGLEECGVV